MDEICEYYCEDLAEDTNWEQTEKGQKETGRNYRKAPASPATALVMIETYRGRGFLCVYHDGKDRKKGTAVNRRVSGYRELHNRIKPVPFLVGRHNILERTVSVTRLGSPGHDSFLAQHQKQD